MANIDQVMPVELWHAIGFGAIGGLIVEVTSVFGYLTAWQSARREGKRLGRLPLPCLGRYVDPPADGLVALTRILMGAGAGWLLSNQLTGAIAAVAVGAAAPALLKQIGSARTFGAVQHRAEVSGEDPVPSPGQVAP